MGLIGDFLAYYDTSMNIDNSSNYYSATEFKCSHSWWQSNDIYYSRNEQDFTDILQSINSYEQLSDISYTITTYENVNINIPSDICNNTFDINNSYNKIFNIELDNSELSNNDISRVLIYKYPLLEYYDNSYSYNENKFYINKNNEFSDVSYLDISLSNNSIVYSTDCTDMSTHVLDVSSSNYYGPIQYLYEYYTYLLNNCKNLYYKNAYFRIDNIRFFDGNDISGNANVNKIYKKSIILQCLISVYENKNLVDEVINYKRIGCFTYRKEIYKEDVIENIWNYCYNNIKIELENYNKNIIDNNELFKNIDISSTIIDY
tara:strand:- start:5247 stop:6200 length:954 start_codon:yes stop_codon:yes gene_type:complete